MSTANAVAREAAWLATSGDGLPALLATAGGPFGAVQAYYPRSPAQRKRSVYVLRDRLVEMRFGGVRKIDRYSFRLAVHWSVSTGTGHAETEQQAFDDALDLLVQRIRGPLLDHTHGGRFLSVAEEPDRVDVALAPPEHTLTAAGAPYLAAEVRYSADDQLINS